MRAPRTRDQRHGGLAAQLSGLSQEEALARLTGRSVVVDWPVRLETTVCGRALIRTTANLVVRFCPELRVAPRTVFASEIADLLIAIDSDAVPFAAPPEDVVRVHLGGGHASANITGSSSAWLSYVSGCGEELPELVDGPNMIGAHAAAAFVAGETFKHALPLRGQYAFQTAKTAYSVYEYGEPTAEAPDIGPVTFRPTPLLVGIGAIGQACLDTLISARTVGELRVVDRGFVDDETNLNRSVLAVESDVHARTPKVALAVRRAKGSGLQISPHPTELSEIIQAIETRQMPWPRVIASALDNREARQELQGLWPDLVLDAATGDTMAQVFRSSFSEGLACLRCLYSMVPATQSYEQTMSSRTGISPARIAAVLQDTNAKVTQEMVDAAPADLKEIALRHQGTDVCGYLRDVERYFGIRIEEPVLLSVSFTSYLAGVFLAAELIKHFAGVATSLISRYQIDSLVNLIPERPFTQSKDPRCYCVEREETVREFRRRMRAVETN